MALRFTFDPNRCTGCQACVVGCWMEHREHQALPWRRVYGFNPFHHPALPDFKLSFACHHCAEPACLLNCPVAAYTKDHATGAVVLDASRCMGCRYCTWACPHDAPQFHAAAGTVEKCSFCLERLEQGQEPACVARCPVEALGIEERVPGDPDPECPGLPPSGTRPGIRIAPLRRAEGPELGFAPPEPVLERFLDQVLALPEAKITLRGEWSLVLFTTAFSVLVAWLGAANLGGPAVSPWAFLAVGGGVLALAVLHLGRPSRAWRAGLHGATSWLSREILLTTAFLGLGGLHVLGFLPGRGLGWAATALGFAALFAMDRIYRVALRMGPWNLHSALVLFNGLYLFGLLARLWPLAFAVGALKLALTLHRRRLNRHRLRPVRLFSGSLRLTLGFVAPLVCAPLDPVLAGLFAVLGDLVDRCEYYDDLEIPTPTGHLASAFREQRAQRPADSAS
jgi:Fe-S-cluster-containing dehydrogenase component